MRSDWDDQLHWERKRATQRVAPRYVSPPTGSKSPSVDAAAQAVAASTMSANVAGVPSQVTPPTHFGPVGEGADKNLYFDL